MSHRRRYVYLSTLVLLATSPLAVFATPDAYIGSDGDFWSVPTNWSAGLPASSSDVSINPASPVTVQLNTSATINSLTLGASDELSMLAGGSLRIQGNSVVNPGTLLMNATSQLFFSTNATLSGGGQIIMAGSMNSIGGSGLISSDNVITGQGTLGGGNFRFINSGSITATGGAGIQIALSPLTGSSTNNGALRTDGAPLTIMGLVDNNAGTIQAVNNSPLNFGGKTLNSGVAVTGGLISISGGSPVSVYATVNGPAISNATMSFLDPSTVTLAMATTDLNAPALSNVTIIGNPSITGQVMMAGTINISGVVSGLAGVVIQNSVSSAPSGPLLLSGGGSLTLQNGAFIPTNRTPSVQNEITLTGTGTISGGSTTQFLNTGVIRGEGGVLNVSSIINTDGLIEAANGATVYLSGGITGGIVRCLDNGTINLLGTFTNIAFEGPTNVLHGTSTLLGLVTLNDAMRISSAIIGVGTDTTITGGSLLLSGNSTIAASSNGLLNLNTYLSGSVSLRTPIVNTGTISASAGGITLTYGLTEPFTSTGTLCANSGSVSFSQGICNISGTMEAVEGGAFNFFVANANITCPLNLNSGFLNINGGTFAAAAITGQGIINFSSNPEFPVTTILTDGISAAALQIGANVTSTVRANDGNAGTSAIRALTISSDTSGNWTGKFDLNDNALILLNADTTSKVAAISALASQIASGKNGGTWNGEGITSSTTATNANTTLALVDNAELGASSFRGQAALDSNSIVVVEALLGDTDLSGTVDFADLTRVAQNFGQTGGWAVGNMDGPENGGTSPVVDFADLLLVAQHFGQTLAWVADGGAVNTLPVPEPGGLAVLALAGVVLGRRRRGK